MRQDKPQRTDSQSQVELSPVAQSERDTLWRLLELYLYDFSELTGDDVNERGEFDYGNLDRYWTEAGRYPFFVRVNGKLAGLVLVRALTPYPEYIVYSVAEFFVMRKYRRQGIGRAVAFQIFDRFPGRWQVEQLERNVPAQQFWRKVIGEYTGGKYEEARHADGPAQHFAYIKR